MTISKCFVYFLSSVRAESIHDHKNRLIRSFQEIVQTTAIITSTIRATSDVTKDWPGNEATLAKLHPALSSYAQPNGYSLSSLKTVSNFILDQ